VDWLSYLKDCQRLRGRKLEPILFLRTDLLRLQDTDERWDICEVDHFAAITICFGLEITGL